MAFPPSLKRPRPDHDNQRNSTSEKTRQKRKKEKRCDRDQLKPYLSHQAVPYQEPVPLSELPQSDIDAFLSTNKIFVEDPKTLTLRPIKDFCYLPKMNERIRRHISSFKAPTPIQAAVWPYILAGRSCVGIAETGSGKTLAFGLPCIRYVQAQNIAHTHKRVRAAIVSPTRELAIQIFEELQKLIDPGEIKIACAYGGVPKDNQRKPLQTAQIIVGTPGRLLDFIQEGSVDLGKVRYLVLDEADRMLDKGFADDIRKIISRTSQSNRQTLMFTATWPPGIRELAATYMRNPVKVIIGDNHTGDLRANERIVQTVEVIRPEEKDRRLLSILTSISGRSRVIADKLLVFCLYKREASRIEQLVRANGFKVAGIHGDMSQLQRSSNLDQFKCGTVPILVATDVAARGLDIPSVKQVINFTFPLTIEDYVHRIGRTGRAGKQGSAITLFTEHEKTLSGSLVNVLRAANQPVPQELLKFGTTVKKKAHSIYGDFYRDTSNEVQKATKITFD